MNSSVYPTGSALAAINLPDAAIGQIVATRGDLELEACGVLPSISGAALKVQASHT